MKYLLLPLIILLSVSHLMAQNLPCKPYQDFLIYEDDTLNVVDCNFKQQGLFVNSKALDPNFYTDDLSVTGYFLYVDGTAISSLLYSENKPVVENFFQKNSAELIIMYWPNGRPQYIGQVLDGPLNGFLRMFSKSGKLNGVYYYKYGNFIKTMYHRRKKHLAPPPGSKLPFWFIRSSKGKKIED